MNKDWLLFFFFLISPPLPLLYSKPCLCLTLQKDEINVEYLAPLRRFRTQVAAILKWGWLL